MRHVTDGELHAFLDGALDLLPGERGGEVRDHVASCPACQERLQDEEVLRAEVTTILGDPAFDNVTLPTFEELRERAEAPGADQESSEAEQEAKGRYRGPLRGLPLAWAATIILAVGVGWMGGQVFSTLPSNGRQDGLGVQYVPAERPAAVLSDLDTEPEPGETVQPTAADLAVDPTSVGAQELDEVVAGRSRRDELEVAPPPTEQPKAVDDSRLNPEAILASRARLSPGETQDPPVAKLGAGDAEPAAGMALMESELFEVQSAPTPFSADPDSLERSLAVPGLLVETIEWEERIPGEKALLIRQLLPPSDTLELRYLGLLLGTETQPERREEEVVTVDEVSGGRRYANVLEASLPPGWNQVVMERDRGLLVARATISKANLKALLKSLH